MRISDWSSDLCSSDLFKDLLFNTPFTEWLINTVIISVVATFLSLAASVFGAYAIACLRFQGSKQDRKRVESGKSVSVRVDNGCRRLLTKKCTYTQPHQAKHLRVTQ